VISSIIGLLALGGAQKVYYTTVGAGRVSGFSQPAEYISKNKGVRDALLGRE
jgi:hypothetical protein